MNKIEQANTLHSFFKVHLHNLQPELHEAEKTIFSWIENCLTDKKQRAGENCSVQILQMEISPKDCPNLIVFISDLKKSIQLTLSSFADSEISNWQENNAKNYIRLHKREENYRYGQEKY